MNRTTRSLLLPLTFGLLFSTPFLGCSSGGSGSGSSGGSAKGGSSSGGSSNGGSAAGGSASGGSNSGGSAKGGSNSGGSNSGGSNAGGSNAGGSNAGGSNAGGSNAGGSNAGGSNAGGSNAGGSSAGGSNAGGSSAGGSSAGGSSAGGSSGGGGSTSACPAGDTVISDFESTAGKADMNPVGTPKRTGYWYTYFPGSDTSATPASGMTQTPKLVNGAPIDSAASTDGASCSKYALHATGSGFGTSPNNYAGIGAAFLPHNPYDKISDAYDVSKYTGISFKMKSGTGTPPAVFFEVLTKDSQPSTSGGTATNQKIDLYNTRGQMLYTPWTENAISSTYQTFTVPFGTLIPRWVPDSTGCASATTPKCQAKAFVPTNVLGIQISMYQDNGFPKPSGSTAGTYDLWVDDVQFTTDDSGLQKRTGFPLTSAGSMGSCLKPQGPSADAKFLVPAYNQWKATFATGGKVIRPENGNDTVSEGIAYGMLIAVNMNDQTLFDSLYSYWKGHAATGNLMTWCIPAGGGSCSASGGSATDADEDAAYALLQAGKAWGGTYKTDAISMMKDVWDKDIDGAGTKIPKGGSNYASPTGAITNASYFAPAFYKAFAAADTDTTHDWAGVITAVYKVLNGSITGSNGLIPAWCSSSCTAAASNGAATDVDYQYDSHRIPMRIGMDYCFNGTADAKTYTTKTTAFFADNVGKNGIGYILDMYTPSGGAVSGTAPNSSSIIGTAAVGAMASGNQTFLNDAYQAVFDSVTRGAMAPVDTAGKTPYSYYNATVGMLTLLIMTGNFMH